MPKQGRILVLDSADFDPDTYKEFEGILIRGHPQHVSKIVILYFDFMLNLAYINNYLFLFFFLKNRSYRHYVLKGGGKIW